ncbi:hypothetical protein FGU65_08845 [Methanoculleus sp. FWC-SCC1]|uniref:Uncharacterized protein n=1 Tax=Methanoculleus frigidifontis TaxID=2584085 RepID=A0ABT8MAT7_9EURY|nr:hypothetical protein [Methanoculleus sp. FWC-SCC1]MDN7024991.1 hypothetical protein [Methanoculleus sp. FWC-SCC1]
MKWGVCLTALDDLVMGAATFGLYSLWKATRQARMTVRKTEVAVEGLTDGIETSTAALGATAAQIAGDLSVFARELEGLMIARGAVPRSETDLGDVAAGRLRALRAKETELLDELARRGIDAEAAGAWGGVPPDAIAGESAGSEEDILLLRRLAIVRSAIDEMLYVEPGVVPACLYDVEEVLRRFNTLEQTGIEDLLGATRDTIEGSEAVLREFESLFVARTYRLVDTAALSAGEQEELARLRSSVDLYNQLIAKNTKALSRLQEELLYAHPDAWDGFPGGAASGSGGETESSEARSGDPVQVVPKSARIARSLRRTDISAILVNHAALLGINRYYQRERLRAEKRIASLTHAAVEEPGVVPGTLEETRLTIARFRTEGQPRLELLIDNLNEALVASRNVAARTDRVLARAETVSALIPQNPLVLWIGGALILGLAAAVLVVLLILLVRLVLVL